MHKQTSEGEKHALFSNNKELPSSVGYLVSDRLQSISYNSYILTLALKYRLGSSSC